MIFYMKYCLDAFTILTNQLIHINLNYFHHQGWITQWAIWAAVREFQKVQVSVSIGILKIVITARR